MTIGKIRTVVEKEFDEIMRNKYILMTLLLAPLLIAVVLPVAVVSPAVYSPDSYLSSDQTSFMAKAFGGGGSQEALIIFLMIANLPLFMVLPAVLPTVIASYGIIGEKKNRTLEPLLAAPVTVYDILIGKALSAMIPALLATWLSVLIFFAVSELIIYTGLHTLILPDPALWAVGVLILAPLLAFLGIMFAIIISSRVNDPRVAQQISVLLIMPIMGLFIGQFSGLLLIDVNVLLGVALLVLVVDLVVVRLGKSLFDREEILTRWK